MICGEGAVFGGGGGEDGVCGGLVGGGGGGGADGMPGGSFGAAEFGAAGVVDWGLWSVGMLWGYAEEPSRSCITC